MQSTLCRTSYWILTLDRKASTSERTLAMVKSAGPSCEALKLLAFSVSWDRSSLLSSKRLGQWLRSCAPGSGAQVPA